jgi:hypothetical protein
MSVAVSGNYYGAGSGVDGYAATFIPEIWSGKMQQKFYEATVLAQIANTDWEGEIKDQGDTVKIRTVPSITIRNYEKGQTLLKEVPATSVVELLIDQGKYWNAVADDIDKVQADLRLMDLFANEASEQMKITIDTDVLSFLKTKADAANRGQAAGVISGDINLGDGFHATTGSRRSAAIVNTGGDSASFTPLDFLINMGLAMDEQNLPESGRFAVVPAWFAAMIKKGDLKDASISGDGTSIARNGRIGTIDRFEVFTSNLLPTQTGITDTKNVASKKGFHVYAGVKAALTFASQITKVETLRAESTFGDLMRGLNVYGRKVVQPKALVEGFVSR